VVEVARDDQQVERVAERAAGERREPVGRDDRIRTAGPADGDREAVRERLREQVPRGQRS